MSLEPNSDSLPKAHQRSLVEGACYTYTYIASTHFLLIRESSEDVAVPGCTESCKSYYQRYIRLSDRAVVWAGQSMTAYTVELSEAHKIRGKSGDYFVFSDEGFTKIRQEDFNSQFKSCS